MNPRNVDSAEELKARFRAAWNSLDTRDTERVERERRTRDQLAHAAAYGSRRDKPNNNPPKPAA